VGNSWKEKKRGNEKKIERDFEMKKTQIQQRLKMQEGNISRLTILDEVFALLFGHVLFVCAVHQTVDIS
jgi:hypothetical protein